jgi:sugar lactone lactonase YvrE
VPPSNGTVTVIAGSGAPGFSGDNGHAARARLNSPAHCALDGAGNLFIADAGNHSVRVLDLVDQEISCFAGNGSPGYSGDGGPAGDAQLDSPYSVASEEDGDVYISDRGNRAIRKVDYQSGVITTVAGGSGRGSQLVDPAGISLDGDGGLLICDPGAHRVWRLDLESGELSPFAGNGKAGEAADGDEAVSAGLSAPCAVAVDGDGNVYVTERGAHRVLQVDTDGMVYVLAGTGAAGMTGDEGPAASAMLNSPEAIAADVDGNMVLADTGNSVVRALPATADVIVRVAGGGRGALPALSLTLSRPAGCAIDPDGILYISDTGNHRVLSIDIAAILHAYAEDYDELDDEPALERRSAQDGEYEDE